MQVEHNYAVPPARLYNVITDVGYLTERSRRYGGVSDPTVAHSPGAVVVTTQRQIPVDKLPSLATRYLGDGRLVQIDRWTDPGADDLVIASLTVDAGRMPLEMSGRHEIRSTAAGCVYRINVDMAVKVRLVGPAISIAVASQLEKLLTAEMAFTETWLAGGAR